RQSAPGLEIDNLTFSLPEIGDLAARVDSIETFGDFSTIDFTLTGIGTPRVVHAGVVSGSFFEVMGLRPVLGRLLTPADDGPTAAPMVSEHPEAYAADGRTQVSVTPLREQITAPARPVLFILLGAAAVVFLVACSNVA